MTRDCGGRVWLNRSRSWENFGAELKKGGRNAEDVWVLSAPHEAGEVRFQFFAHKFCCFSLFGLYPFFLLNIGRYWFSLLFLVLVGKDFIFIYHARCFHLIISDFLVFIFPFRRFGGSYVRKSWCFSSRMFHWCFLLKFLGDV